MMMCCDSVDTNELNDSRVHGSSLVVRPMPVSAQLLNALLLVYSVGFKYCTRWTVLSREKCIPQQPFFVALDGYRMIRSRETSCF